MTDVAALQRLKAGVVRPALFFRMATDPLVRVWSGAGDFAVPADLIETEGGLYQGFGDILEFPALDQLVNGVATRIDFMLSGVGENALRLADEDAAQVRGSAVNIGLMELDEDWQPSSAMQWIWEGEADFLTMDSRLQSDSRIETVTLSVGSLFTGRRRPRFRHYTDQEQRRRSPDDRLCDRVTLYSQSYTKTWPRF